MNTSMKAAVLHAKKDIRYEEIPTPAVGKDEVRVKVAATGICGSDIPRFHADAAHSFPLILGHEFSGYVDEVGEGVDSVKKGDHVAGIPLVPCFECDDCKKGNYWGAYPTPTTEDNATTQPTKRITPSVPVKEHQHCFSPCQDSTQKQHRRQCKHIKISGKSYNAYNFHCILTHFFALFHENTEK